MLINSKVQKKLFQIFPIKYRCLTVPISIFILFQLLKPIILVYFQKILTDYSTVKIQYKYNTKISKMNKNSTILYMCAYICNETIKRYNKIVHESGMEVYWMIDETNSSKNLSSYPDIPFVSYNFSDLANYYKIFSPINRSNDNYEPYFRGNSIFPIIDFAYRYNYSNYWVVEYDVIFTGDWSLIFSQEKDNQKILIQKSRTRLTRNYHWKKCFNSSELSHGWNGKPIYCGMLNLFRASRKFLFFLNSQYNKLPVNRYHYESFVSTHLMHNSNTFPFKLIKVRHNFLDCYLTHYVKRLLKLRLKNSLFHPVKLDWTL